MDASEKKAAVAAWRERKVRAGIYALRCVATGQVWVGRAPDLATIWTRQAFVLRLGGHMRPALQAAWNAHGPDAILFETLEELAEDVSEANRDAFLKTRLAAWRETLGAEPV